MTEARQPSKPTLRKYGITVDEWRALLDLQGGVCGVCGKLPASGTLHIDHFHARGWARMAPAQRKLHVRGLACHVCNRFHLARNMSVAKAKGLLAYLERFRETPPAGG